jgi:hypothetical protein
VERLSGVDRKTVRRYVTAAEEAGPDRPGGEDQLTDDGKAETVQGPQAPDVTT